MTFRKREKLEQWHLVVKECITKIKKSFDMLGHKTHEGVSKKVMGYMPYEKTTDKFQNYFTLKRIL